jgi:hypothetical protein
LIDDDITKDPKPNLDEILKEMQAQTIDPEAWGYQFKAIDSLRKLNKYHTEFLMQNIDKFMPFIIDSIESLRSGI